MKRLICLLLAACLLLALAACGGTAAPKTEEPAKEEVREWTRRGYFTDEAQNMLSVIWMDDIDEPGWYVGCMLGEDLIEDSWGGTLAQEGNSLHGVLGSSDSKGEITVTVSEDGENGLLLAIEGGETYRFTEMELQEASIFVTINIEGWGGSIAYAEGEAAPEIDPEYPFQSAQVNLAEPAVYTILAQAEPGFRFVKWTRNGEDLSTEPQVTLQLDESADFLAVFEEDPDWQNPVMNFVGEYQCDRAHATVECFGKEEARITIEWGGSAWDSARWLILGKLDPETLTIEYSGANKANVVYDENGEIKSEETVYEDGTGTIVFGTDGSFTWHEDQSENGTDMVFEWLPVQGD